MRSVFSKILAASLVITAFSLLCFLVIIRVTVYNGFKRGGPLVSLLTEQSAEAERRLGRGGSDAVASYFNELARQFPATTRSFLDKRGLDLITGGDRRKELAKCESLTTRLNPFAPMYVCNETADGRFVLLFKPSPTSVARYLLYFYLLLVAAVVLLCLIFRREFLVPLIELGSVVRRFGGGDLKARIRTLRRDELGELGRDIDDMASRIETLVNAERRLLQDISHELRTPLARLSFAVELLETSTQKEAALARVHKQIARLTNLIENLVEVTRIEGDSSARTIGPVSIYELLREVVEDAEIEAGPRGCRILLDSAKNFTLEADRELLRRAFENIVRNAIRHAPGGSNIEVNIDSSPAGACISIRDEGSGVPDEQLDKIFQPFYRVDHSRARATGGVGLGLAIAERAIRVHHGNIWAENGRPGLMVCVDLPIDASSRIAGPESSSSAKSGSSGPY